jgi:signal peptidase I
MVSNKPRRPWLAALLTLLQTGLGHIYAGSFKRGLVLFFIGQFLWLLFAVSVISIAPGAPFMIFAIAVGVAFFVFCVADAALIAKRKKEAYEPAKYNRWFVYVGYALIAGLLGQALSSFIVIPNLIQSFKLPSGAMEPTLLIGDQILVNKHIYRTSEPKRSDVIVFKYPRNPEVAYIKRLIGIPGDKVEMVGRTVYINGKPLKENYTQYIDPGSIQDHFGPIDIPSGKYFVMGDNRDNSQDSRYWGFVPREYLLGKPLIIYWSFETGRQEYLQTGISARLKRFADVLLHFFSKTHWRRTFQVIE